LDAAGAQGTHLKTSLQDLQKLGVTNVSVSGQSGTVDLGAQGLNLLDGKNLPTFGDTNNDGILSTQEDAALSITLDLGVNALLPAQDAIYDFLASKGIDTIKVHDALNTDGTNWVDLSSLNTIHQDNIPNDPGLTFEIVASGSSGQDAAVSLDTNLITSVDLLKGYTTQASYGELIKALSDTGVLDVLVDQGNVKVGDTLAKALIDAGMLHALPNANLSLVYQPTSANDPYAYLDTSLKDMAALGVNSVDYSAVNQNKVYVDLGLPINDVNALNDVKALLGTLESQNTTSGVFNHTLGAPATALVVNHTFADLISTNGTINAAVIDGLVSLGITEIDILFDANLGNTPPLTQSGTIPGSTVTVNYIGSEDPLYDYLHLKHPTL
jgi:hypothetical protein